MPKIPTQRIVAVDAARGCAIAFACLSHIKEHFAVSAPQVYWWLASTTRIATPTFLLLSGFVIGHLLRTDERSNLRFALLDRGLFLLIVGHILLSLSDVPVTGLRPSLFGGSVITDSLGVAVFVAVLLRAASAVTLTVLGIGLCLASWWIVMSLTVQSEWALYAGAILFGTPGTAATTADAPVVPFLGVFLIGMALSLHLRPALLANSASVAARRIALFGIAAVGTAVIGALAWRFGREYLAEAFRDPEVTNYIKATLNPRSKRPPSPTYLMLYGGMGLLMLAAFLRGQPRWLFEPIIRVSAVIGRASLLCFVMQDWLLFLVPWTFGFSGIQSLTFWFIYLAACLLCLYGIAMWWRNVNGNRFFTVGLRALARRRLGAGRSSRADVTAVP